MNPNWLELVNEVQRYDIKPEILYKLYIDILQKKIMLINYKNNNTKFKLNKIKRKN